MPNDDTGSLPLAPNERLDIVNARLRLIQRIDGLTFGTDAYLLSAFIRSIPHGKGVELGGGTGIVSLLTLARSQLSHVRVIEIQPDFAALCTRNARLNGLETQMTVEQADVRALHATGDADMVFSNPPYMRRGAGRENTADVKNIARREVCGTILDFCRAAAGLTRWGGYFSVVYRPERSMELFQALTQSGFTIKRLVWVYPSAHTPPCLLLAEAKRGGKEGVQVAPPLILYTDRTHTVYTAETERIYREGRMDFLFTP